MSGVSERVRSLGLTPVRLNELIDRLESGEQESAQASDEWISFRRTDVPIEMEHPGGGRAHCRACAWRISTHAIKLLWSGYVHPGTQCEIELTSIWGAREPVRGVVRACRHVDGTVHELDVRFVVSGAEGLDLGRFLRDDAVLARLAARNTSVESLSGRIALLDESPLMVQLVTRFLADTSVEVVGVDAPDALLEAVKDESGVDAVMVSDAPGALDGDDSVIARLRAAGFTGSVVVVTSETDRSALDAIRSAGASGTLHKPFDRETLMGAMARWLKSSGGSEGGAIHSTLAGDEHVSPLLAQFVEEARTQARQAVEAATEGRLDEAQRLCRSLEGAAGCFGFGELAGAARAALSVLGTSPSPEEASRELARLSGVADRLEAPAAPEKKAG